MPGCPEIIFYDGSCALCHRSVRFVLRRDRAALFQFAPLDGHTFRERLGNRKNLPDSFVLVTASGDVLTRSPAVLHLLRRLGGAWRALAALCGLAPRPVRDALYDGIARTRYRLFGREADICPLVPPELRSRFLP